MPKPASGSAMADSSETIIIGWQARLYPHAREAEQLHRMACHVRGLWNRLVALNRAYYRASSWYGKGKFLWRYDLQRVVSRWIAQGHDWIAELPSISRCEICRRVDAAFQKMTRDRKAGRPSGFPRFKKRAVNEGGIYVAGSLISIRGRTIKLPKVKRRIKFDGGTIPPGRIMSVMLWRRAGRWFLSCQIEQARPAPLRDNGRRCSVKMAAAQITLYDGRIYRRIPIEDEYRRYAKRLRRAQRKLARRQNGSARWRRQANRVARVYERIAEHRRDTMHKLSHRLVRDYAELQIEKFDLKPLLRRHPGDGLTGLRRRMAGAAIGAFLQQLKYKADWRGRRIVECHQLFPRVQICSKCGTVHDMPLQRRMLRCACGFVLDRGANAARNLRDLAEAQRVAEAVLATGSSPGSHGRGVSSAGGVSDDA